MDTIEAACALVADVNRDTLARVLNYPNPMILVDANLLADLLGAVEAEA